MVDLPVDAALENVGPGGTPLTFSDLADGTDFVVVFLQRDHYCTNCRDQVRTVAARIDDFRDRGAEPVSVVPEPVDRVREWQDEYDLPYPLLADPDAAAGEAFDQPVRFGILGDWSDFLGRMPLVVVVDGRREPLEAVWTHEGRSTFDRPSVDDVLDAIDSHRQDSP
jgi:peroxiredoxin Q/BCP